jgi:hypothetical protein
MMNIDNGGFNMSTISTPNGHIVTMADGSAFVTSPNVANDIVDALSTIVNAMATDLSELTGIPVDDILRDYAEECEIDAMTAAFNAVNRRRGIEPFKTPTRIVIESKLQQEKENDIGEQ